MERIKEDAGWQDFEVPLDEEELSFVMITMSASIEENGRFIESKRTKRPMEDPSLAAASLPVKETEKNGRGAWCSLYYQFSYHIQDSNQIKVGERDHSVSGFVADVQSFWDETDMEILLNMKEEEVASKLAIAERYSNSLITIQVNEEQIQFERMDERDMI